MSSQEGQGHTEGGLRAGMNRSPGHTHSLFLSNCTCPITQVLLSDLTLTGMEWPVPKDKGCGNNVHLDLHIPQLRVGGGGQIASMEMCAEVWSPRLLHT